MTLLTNQMVKKVKSVIDILYISHKTVWKHLASIKNTPATHTNAWNHFQPDSNCLAIPLYRKKKYIGKDFTPIQINIKSIIHNEMHLTYTVNSLQI